MKPDDTYNLAVQILDEYIATGKLRRTHERYIILRQICNFPAQFTAEQLQLLCTKELAVSRATIYNTLQLLLDASLLISYPLYAGSKTTCYELCIKKNSRMYFRCSQCGRVVEFEDKSISSLVKNRRYSNFVPTNLSLYVFGTCKVCRRQSKRGGNKNSNSI